MNFGFGPSTPSWKPRRRHALAQELRELAAEFGLESSQVEVDGLYHGVRLRRLTGLTEDSLAELVRRAEAIYAAVMEAN